MDERFGGLPEGVAEVEVLTGLGGGDCGVPFKPGSVWLIDASSGNDGALHASICSHTRELSSAAVELGILHAQRAGAKVPSLTGVIAQRNRTFKGPIDSHAPVPLRSLLVRVKSGDKIFEAQSDAQGLYALFDLPEGKYEFVPELPSGTRLSWYIGSDRPESPIEVRDQGCHIRNIDVFPSGSVQGRVVDESGKALPSAFVYIVPANWQRLPDQRQLYWEYQDVNKTGAFRFVHLPAGDYHILVNPDDSRQPEFPYARTWYPGVHDRDSASVIHIRPGDQVTAADIRVNRLFRPRELQVRVTWSDGRLIRDFVYLEVKPTGNAAALADTRQPDLSISLITLTIDPDESYTVEAQLTCRYSTSTTVGPGPRLRSPAVTVRPADGQNQLQLQLAENACPAIAGKEVATERRF